MKKFVIETIGELVLLAVMIALIVYFEPFDRALEWLRENFVSSTDSDSIGANSDESVPKESSLNGGGRSIRGLVCTA